MPELTCRNLRQARRLHAAAVRTYDRGGIQKAECRASQALAALEDDPHRHLMDIIGVRRTLARALMTLGRWQEAAEVLDPALTLVDGAERVSPTELRDQLVDALTLMGDLERLLGRYAAAEAYLGRAVATAAQLKDGKERLAEACNALGILFKDTGRYEEARVQYERADALTTDPVKRASLLHNLAGLAHAQEDYARGEPLARRALTLRAAVLGASHPDVAADRAVLGALVHGLGRHGEAERLFREALATFEKTYGGSHYEVAVNYGNLAAVCVATGRLAEAEDYLRRALDIKVASLGHGHPDIANLLNNLGFLHARRGRPTQALRCYRQAAAIFEDSLGRDHPSTTLSRENYQGLARGRG